MGSWAETEGLPFPLGATWIPQDEAYNFALYSEHATGVTLHLYAEQDLATPLYQYRIDYLKNKTGRVWHCRLPMVPEARYYAYQVEGPFDPAAGQREIDCCFA